MAPPSPSAPLRSLVRRVVAWPTESQHAACRNAMVATNELARRRQERLEAEAFVARHLASRAPTPVAPVAPLAPVAEGRLEVI